MEIKNKNLCFVGDIHGEFAEIVYRGKEAEDTAFLILGDCGIGFGSPGWITDIYKRKLKKRLEERGNVLYCFRGNHDDPEFYKEGGLIDLPGLKTIPDYTHLTFKDRKIVCIGGGVSVDKDTRLKEESRNPKKGKLWWPGERITRDLTLLDPTEDIIVSHMAPLCIGPICTREEGMSQEIYQDILTDRRYLTAVLQKKRPSRWFFGHYHQSCSGDYADTLWRGLGIKEILTLYT